MLRRHPQENPQDDHLFARTDRTLYSWQEPTRSESLLLTEEQLTWLRAHPDWHEAQGSIRKTYGAPYRQGPITDGQSRAETSASSSSGQSIDLPRVGYMDIPSAFELDEDEPESASYREDAFLAQFPRGEGLFSFCNDNDEIETIPNVNVDIVGQGCPMLALAFESSRSGPRLHLDILNSMTALPFLRFLYTGSYAAAKAGEEGFGGFDGVPTSLMLHCQMYRLGDIYDLERLKSLAYVNVLRQCEFGCSSPDKPIDLCAAIAYIYKHLPRHESLIDVIVNYCVTCFLQHNLATDPEFRQLAFKIRQFNQALVLNVTGRRSDADAFQAIIQLPYDPQTPPTHASREMDRARVDCVYHFHGDNFIPKKNIIESPSGGIAFRLKDAAPREPIPEAVQHPPAEPSHEPEFELVLRLAEVLNGPESDSDSDSFVKIENEEAGPSNRAAAPTEDFDLVTLADELMDESDSDWSMLSNS